jgi:hypothetical protein
MSPAPNPDVFDILKRHFLQPQDPLTKPPLLFSIYYYDTELCNYAT